MEEAAVEEVGQAWAEAEAVFVGGRQLSGGSKERWKWDWAEEVSKRAGDEGSGALAKR